MAMIMKGEITKLTETTVPVEDDNKVTHMDDLDEE